MINLPFGSFKALIENVLLAAVMLIFKSGLKVAICLIYLINLMFKIYSLGAITC